MHELLLRRALDLNEINRGIGRYGAPSRSCPTPPHQSFREIVLFPLLRIRRPIDELALTSCAVAGSD